MNSETWIKTSPFADPAYRQMEISVLLEAGADLALMGMSLSYYDAIDGPVKDWWDDDKRCKAYKRANKLAFMGGGHNKFLESIQVWLLIKATRDWWQEFDTYRVGVTKNSSSTMHTLSKRIQRPEDFHEGTTQAAIDNLNALILAKEDVKIIKVNMPEGFFQYRQVNLSYMNLLNMIRQRQKHRLPDWPAMCAVLRANLEHPEWVFQDLAVDQEES